MQVWKQPKDSIDFRVPKKKRRNAHFETLCRETNILFDSKEIYIVPRIAPVESDSSHSGSGSRQKNHYYY